MKTIEINNLRNICSGEVKLELINVLVGANGTGKSTFLRFFPLMKQSINRKLNGALLWSGSDDYVDFGSFSEAVKDKEKAINFAFKADYTYPFRSNQEKLQQQYESKIIFTIKNYRSVDYVSSVEISILDYKYVVNFHSNKKIKTVFINEIDVFKQFKDLKKLFNYEIILGNFYSIIDEIFPYSLSYRQDNYIYKKVMHDESYSRIIDETIQKKIFRLPGRPFLNYFIYKLLLNTEVSADDFEIDRSLHSKLDSLDVDSELEIRLHLSLFESLCSFFSTYITSYFKSVHYIAPVRATAERYYRYRNLAVDEIDSQGKNISEFLNSLKIAEREDFKSWTQHYFGYKYDVDTAKTHLSIKITQKNSKSVNLSDTGFGYSQILPIIVQLWMLSRENIDIFDMGIFEYYIVAIEQPELHLHPELQAKLLDVIMDVAKKYKIIFIIETHSETIINRIGTQIYEGYDKNDVNVFIFEKSNDANIVIKRTQYDDNGYIESWPVGFFMPQKISKSSK